MYDDFHGIIFCQTKMEVIELEAKLQQRGYAVASLHGDKQQREREITLKKFRTGEAKVLVATDVAARGLDVKDLTHVINHSLPWDVESYVHRIGRTGRNGKEGIAISLINPRQVSSLRRLQNVTKKTLEKGKIPTADEVALTRLQKFMSQLTGVPTEGRKYQLALEMFKELVQKDETGLMTLASPELLARVITALHPEILAEKDYDLDFMKGGLEQRGGGRRDDRGDRGGRTLSGGYRNDSRGGGYSRRDREDRGGDDRPRTSGFGRRDRGEREERNSDRKESFGPRADRAERSDRGGYIPRSERKDGSAYIPRGDRKRKAGADDSYPRRDRGPRFDGFDFGDGGSEGRKEKKSFGDRKERGGSDRPKRADHPGVKRHKSGTFKRRSASDNA
jgi:ATP-dependent RNA helicase DeaD